MPGKDGSNKPDQNSTTKVQAQLEEQRGAFNGEHTYTARLKVTAGSAQAENTSRNVEIRVTNAHVPVCSSASSTRVMQFSTVYKGDTPANNINTVPQATGEWHGLPYVGSEMLQNWNRLSVAVRLIVGRA